MSELILFPGDPISISEQELPQKVLDLKRAAEEKSQAEVLPDEYTNARVAAEHRSIWEDPNPFASPSVLSESGRKA